MSFLFWSLTFFLCLIAIAILIPWLKINFKSLTLFALILTFSYGLYYLLGASQHLLEYYSLQEQKNRVQMQRIRPLMLALKKQEFRLRFHLQDNPQDSLAQSQLLELLSIQAMQAGDLNLAKEFLVKALEVLPKTKESKERREKLMELMRSLRN